MNRSDRLDRKHKNKPVQLDFFKKISWSLLILIVILISFGKINRIYLLPVTRSILFGHTPYNSLNNISFLHMTYIFTVFSILSFCTYEFFFPGCADERYGIYLKIYHKYRKANMPALLLSPIYIIKKTVPNIVVHFVLLLITFSVFSTYFPAFLRLVSVQYTLGALTSLSLPTETLFKLGHPQSSEWVSTLFEKIGTTLAELIPDPDKFLSKRNLN